MTKTQDNQTIERLRANLRAAKLRTLAANQDAMAESYLRQGQKPIYDGQSMVCVGKAAQVQSLADENRAKADLLDAVTA